jgi:hypothetical protein
MHADPKSAKITVNLSVFFTVLGSAHIKAASTMLVKLTPGAVLIVTLNKWVDAGNIVYKNMVNRNILALGTS